MENTTESKSVGDWMLYFVAVICSTWFAAYTLSILWGWFISPLGAPVIGTAHAWGILLILNTILLRLYRPSKEEFAVKLFGGLGISAGALLIGYILKSFM